MDIENSVQSEDKVVPLDQREKPRYIVADEDIASKSGNYLITVGNPSSGKSTLQNALIYRLWTDRRIDCEHSNLTGNHDHDAILQSWVSNFADGILQEFSIRIGQKKRSTLSLNFLEISGEEIKSIVPVEGAMESPSLNAQLDRYLRVDQINKRFVFLSDASLNRRSNEDRGLFREDILFSTLIRYLLSETGVGLSRISILIVATKWDVVRSEYSSIVDYINKNFPATRALVNSSDRVHAQYIPFSIGEIVTDRESGNQKIMTLESKYIDFLIQWIYQGFQNQTLKGYPKIKLSFWDTFKSLFT
jgi:hypothetical protein